MQAHTYVRLRGVKPLSEVDALLKGGTYLWLFHALNRYSEDLDFTLRGGVSEDLPQRIVETLELFGVASSAC